MLDTRRIKLAYHVLFVFLALCISGCSGMPLLPSPTPEPVTLRFGYREFMMDPTALVEAFQNEYPWIKVEVVKADRFSDQIRSMVRNEQLDIFRDDRGALELAPEGLLKPVDEFLLGDWDVIQDDYFKGTWEGFSIQGRQWGIPAGVDMLVTFINKDQLGALDLSPPQPTWDLFEFINLANEMNYPEGVPYADGIKLFGFCSSPQSVDPIVFIYLHGGSIVDDLYNPTQPALDDQRTIEAIQTYAGLFTRQGVAPDPELVQIAYRQGGIYEAQVRGACGVWFGWYGSRGGTDMPFKWSATWIMLPLPSDQARFSLGDEDGYYVTDACAHPKEAMTFLRFLADREESAGQKLPPRQSLASSDRYAETVGPEAAELAARFSDEVLMVPTNAGPGLEQVALSLFEAVGQIIQGDLNVEEAMAEAQDKCRNAFASP